MIFAGKNVSTHESHRLESVAFEIQKTKKFTLTTNQDDYRPFGGLFDTLRLSLGAVFYSLGAPVSSIALEGSAVLRFERWGGFRRPWRLRLPY